MQLSQTLTINQKEMETITKTSKGLYTALV
jgi:hypothetical protein